MPHPGQKGFSVERRKTGAVKQVETTRSEPSDLLRKGIAAILPGIRQAGSPTNKCLRQRMPTPADVDRSVDSAWIQ